jgi:hypothetical protein
MARCEVAVRANVAFHTRRPPYPLHRLPSAEQVVIEFEGRDFVWHPTLEPGPDGEEWWPGVTVVVKDHNNYDEEAELMHRFLSALTFELRQPIEVLNFGGSGQPDPLAPPVPRAARRGLGDLVVTAPLGVETVADQRLRHVLALYREGLNSESPFYRFLCFWNALEAVFDDNRTKVTRFLNENAPNYARRDDYDPPPSDWAEYLRNSSRNAIAHAVREPGRPVLDPDLPLDRERLYRDSRLLDDLVRAAIVERWPEPVQLVRRTT